MSVNYRTKTKPAETLLEAVETSLLAASRHHVGVEEKPAAILWTDADAQWKPLVAKLQERLKQLIVLGSYDPVRRTGPAIWLNCVVARTIEAGVPQESVPIV